jgi:hypothetical protein
MGKYALGRRALAICDRCGLQFDYHKLRREWTNLRVCDSCWEPKHPQEDPRNPPADAEALFEPRPERKEPMEVTVGKSFPPTSTSILPPAIGIVGEVRTNV